MVGPDSVVSSADDDVEQRQRDDYDETTTTTLSDVAEVDIVQLLTRRLSVTPPTDCATTLERRRMTASTCTEVDVHFYLSSLLSLSLYFSLLFYPLPSLTSRFRSLLVVFCCPLNSYKLIKPKNSPSWHSCITDVLLYHHQQLLR